MKSNDKSLVATLNRYCRKSGSPSAEQVTISVEKVWEQLSTEEENMPLADRKVGPRRFRFTLVFAVLVASAIGAYAAYRGGLLSTRQDVSPVAPRLTPSARAKAENTQVAAITSESTKPGAAPSREEALARAAAQIAAVQATDAGAARPKFAAASVRPVPGPPMGSSFKCLGIDGTVSATARRGRCTGQVELKALVLAAYGTYPPIPFVTGAYERVTGFPDSLTLRQFQIEAVADDPEHVTERELILMLQTLLEDRFKARVHLEMKEVDGYVLTIAKSGIKFKETSLDPKPPCDYNGRLARAVEIFVRGTCRMKELTNYLRKEGLQGNIADKTGLMGMYNIDFVLEPVYLSAPTEGGGGRGGGGGQPVRRQFTTPVPKALEEQLGLHLERTKIPEEFVVVDHIEQPTEN